MSDYSIGLLILIAAGGITYLLVRCLLIGNQNFLANDRPNERSLHTRVIPRGGGLAIVGVIALLWATLSVVSSHQQRTDIFLLCGLVAVCGVGFADDRNRLSAIGRLIIELVVALLVVLSVGGPLVFSAGGLQVSIPSWLGIALAGFSIVWMTNLYNFMDGADGMVAGPSAVVALCLAVWFFNVEDTVLFYLNLGVAGSCVGFLILNWSPAKIFMGDVGSLALGYYFAVMALVGVVQHDLSIGGFILLYGLFLFDTSVTLIRRMVTGKKWWEAHSEHYYQRAVRAGFTHAQVAAGAMTLTALAAGLASMEAFDITSNGIPFFLMGGLILMVGLVLSRLGIREVLTRNRSG